MKEQRWSALWLVSILLMVLLAACGGTQTADTDGQVPVEPTSGGGMVSEDVQGKLYFGGLVAPNVGHTAMFVHEDNSIDLLVIETSDASFSRYMTGTLAGQRLAIDSEVDRTRGLGRPEGPGFEINLAFPARGNLRTSMTESEEGGLYIGDYKGHTAALMVLPDGTVYGVVVFEDDDEFVFEYLCVDGDKIDELTDEITATACESGDEVTLTWIVE